MATSSGKLLEAAASLPWRLQTGFNVLAAQGGGIGDIDGDGREELVVLSDDGSTLGVVSYFLYGDIAPQTPPSGQPVAAQWVADATSMLLMMWVSQGCEIPAAPGGATSWDLGANTPAYCLDVDGDGVDEVVLYNHPYYGVLKWQDGALVALDVTATPGGGWPADVALGFAGGSFGALPDQSTIRAVVFGCPTLPSTSLDVAALGYSQAGGLTCAGASTLTPPAGTNMWSIGLPLYAADIDGDGLDELVFFNQPPAMLNGIGNALGAIKWAGSAFQMIGSASSPVGTSPQVDIDVNDSFFFADVNGDGADEILILDQSNPLGSTTFAVVAWKGGTFQPLSLSTGSFPGINGGPSWTLRPGQVFLFGRFASQADQILVLDPASWIGPAPTFGLIGWTPSNTTPPGTLSCNGLISVTFDKDTGWVRSPATTAYVADVDGDGLDEVVVLNPGLGIGALKMQGGTFAPMGPQSAGRIPAWNLDLIAGAPTNTFPPFTGDRLAIYQKVGPSLEPQAGPDIRSVYNNANNALNFGSWTAQVADADPKQPNWIWLSSYAQADTDAVLQTLAAELGAVSSVYGLYDNLGTLLTNINTQQDSDLIYCIGAMDTQPSGDSTVVYWVGAILDAFIWAVAAIPDLGAPAVALAALASLTGSIFAMPGDSSPISVSYTAFKQTIDNNELYASSQMEAQLTTIVTDPAKLLTLGSLLPVVWYWTPEQTTSMAQSGSNGNRIAFFQVMFPPVYNIAYWTNTKYPYPTCTDLTMTGKSIASLNSPSYCYTSQPAGTGLYNIYLICRGTLIPLDYPSKALMTEVFTTLQVPQMDLFTGSNGWALPSFDGSTLTEVPYGDAVDGGAG